MAQTNGQHRAPTNWFYSNFVAGANVTLTPTFSNLTIAASGAGFVNLEVQTNGTRVGLGTNINWTTGVTGYVSGTTFNLGTTGGGGGTPGGAEANLQVKMGSSFVGSTNTTYDVSNGTLIVSSTIGQTASNIVVLGTNGAVDFVVQPDTHRVGVGTNLPKTAFHVMGNSRFDGNVTNSGHVLFSPDNTYDIGASGATRVRDIWVSSTVTVGGNQFLPNGFFLGTAGSASGYFIGRADGDWEISNVSLNGLTRFRLGGSTAAAPAIGVTNGHMVVFGANGLYAGGNTNGVLVSSGGTKFAKVGGTLFVDTTPVASAGASETNLITRTIPAHTLTNITDRLIIRSTGRFAATANAKQIKLVYGSETILDTGSQIVNSGAWVIEAEILRTGNTAQSASAEFHGAGVTLFTTANSLDLVQTNGIDTVLKVTSTAAGNGDVTNRSMTIEYWPNP